MSTEGTTSEAVSSSASSLNVSSTHGQQRNKPPPKRIRTGRDGQWQGRGRDVKSGRHGQKDINGHYGYDRGRGSRSLNTFPKPGDLQIAQLRVPRRDELKRYEKSIKVSRPRYLTSFTRIKGTSNTWKLGGVLPEYHEPKVGSSLTEGFQEYQEPEDDSTLDFVTEAIRQNKSTAKLLSGFKGFVSFRNNLNKILGTPYLRNEYHVQATRTEEGWIRLDVVKTADPIDERSRRFMYMGRRFEEICLSPSATVPPGESSNSSCHHPAGATEVSKFGQEGETGVAHDEREACRKAGDAERHREHCVVVRAKIGEHEILMGAEIDCVQPRKSNKRPTFDDKEEETKTRTKAEKNQLESDSQSSDVWIELKTSAYQESERQRTSFQKYKLLKFWIQSYLVGVPIIKCGFRKDDILHHIETFETMRIPRIARDRGGWNGNVCLNFAHEILRFIKHLAKDPQKVYRISYCAPWNSIRMYVVGSNKEREISAKS